MDKGKDISWLGVFGVASVWFGTHVGSGFATGTQALTFFSKYGWTAVFMPFLSMLIVVAVHYIGMHAAIYNDLTVGRHWANWLYHPFEGVLGWVFEGISFLCGVLAVSACLSGCGSLLKGTFGLPYMAGVVLISVILVLVAMFGFQVVTSVSGILSVTMIVALVIIFGLGMSHNADNLGTIMSNRVIFEGQSMGGAFFKMIMYGCFQATTVSSLVAINGSYRTSKDIKRYVVIGVIMNTVMLTLSCLTVLSGMPDTVNELPILTVCNSLGMPWIKIVYTIVLFLAFLSTGVTITYGLTKRYALFIKKPMSDITKKLICSIVFIIINILISKLGLLTIINKGYTYMGFVSLILYVIPSFTFGIVKMRRDRKRVEAEEDTMKQTVTMAEGD